VRSARWGRARLRRFVQRGETRYESVFRVQMICRVPGITAYDLDFLPRGLVFVLHITPGILLEECSEDSSDYGIVSVW
jgi:hypothetical protein